APVPARPAPRRGTGPWLLGGALLLAGGAAALWLRPGLLPTVPAATKVPAPLAQGPSGGAVTTAAAPEALPAGPSAADSTPSAPPGDSGVATVVLPARPLGTPETLCAGRNAFHHFTCMERECLRPVFRQHPDCRRWEQVGRRVESP
ncbi:MAG: hypothetical protein KGJ24_15475, partial [Burkholderiales bacterium]|nr:hypothetical protein [Burkholderiales bacterium]